VFSAAFLKLQFGFANFLSKEKAALKMLMKLTTGKLGCSFVGQTDCVKIQSP